MNYSEKALEFNQIKEIWKSYALTNWAKNQIDQAEPILSEPELIKKLRDTTEARILLEKGGNPPLVTLEGIQDYVDISKKGDCLNGFQLEELGKSFVAIKRLKDYLEICKQYSISLAYYEENLNDLQELREMIFMQIRNERVDDNASKTLKTIRTEIDRTETRMKEKADSVMRSHKECMADSFTTYRNGRLCIPVKKEYKFRISGSVIDKSSTGNTLFMEPSSVSKYFEELQLLKVDEENEERRILYTLTVMVENAADIIEENMRIVEKLDFIFSKGKLSYDWDAVMPDINTDRKIVIKNGRHPLMKKEICVPLQFEIGGNIKGIVITGPNTGGKTVAIKTVALNCMMAQCGLHVTCEEASICMNSSFLCDIGDGQNISENLSTFSAHITNVLEIIKNINEESLVIMDELGSGTDPTEGMGIAIAILEELRKSGALFLVTTHYPEVKQYAAKKEGIINARMTFDKESLKPLYHLVIGEAGESCALYIARRLGMPRNMLETAIEAAYGENYDANEILSGSSSSISKQNHIKIQKKKINHQTTALESKFNLGDSVMIYPDKKIGIVCQKVNEKGVLQVQLQNKKIWINHKRVKLVVPASQLYPDDYDFSIVFDTVENRKLRHKMERKYVEGEEILYTEE